MAATMLSAFLLFSIPGIIMAQDNEEKTSIKVEENLPQLIVNGTNKTSTFTIDMKNLPRDESIRITVPIGETA